MTPAPVGVPRLAVLSFGLASGHALPGASLPATASANLVDECGRDGFLGLLGEAVRAGAVALAPDIRAVLEARLQAHARHDLSVEDALLRLGHLLTGADVEWRAVGSAALARVTYPRPELRSLDRARVLVDRVDAERARSIARGSGVDAEISTLPHDRTELFGPPHRFSLGGFELATLPMPQRLLALCHGDHASSARPSAHLRDVAEMVLRERPNLVDVLITARAWGCESELASTVLATWDLLALTEVPAIVAWARGR